MANELNIFKILLAADLVVKIVVLMLAALSIYSWMLFLKKRRQYELIIDGNSRFLEIYRNSSNMNEVVKNIESVDISTLKIMFERGHSELVKIGQRFGGSNMKEVLSRYFSQNQMAPLERSLKQGIVENQESIESSLSHLASIGSLAPFIGLFGTVWGIINSFRGLSTGNASLDAVAPGIAEALVATAIGLMVAIPAVFFYNRLNEQCEKLMSDMEHFQQDFLNMVGRSIIKKED